MIAPGRRKSSKHINLLKEHYPLSNRIISIMQPSALLLMLASSASAFVVHSCAGDNRQNWNNNRCYKYEVGKDLKYFSDAHCRITLYEREDCTGVAWGSYSRDKCLGLPGGVNIRSVSCNDN